MVGLVHMMPNASKSTLIWGTFATYVLFIGLFGVVYTWLHRRKPNNFFFPSELTRWRARTAMESLEKDLAVLRTQLEAMHEVLSATASNMFTGSKTRLPSGHVAEIETYTMHHPAYTESQDRLRLKVWNADGTALCEVEGPQDEQLSQAFLTNWLEEMIAHFANSSDRRMYRLHQIKEDPEHSWGFLDFFYFSLITQTTVGYGDILPNSSAVRATVAAQIIIGYVLLVVVLNIFLTL